MEPGNLKTILILIMYLRLLVAIGTQHQDSEPKTLHVCV